MTQNKKRKQRIERIVENNNKVKLFFENMEYNLDKIGSSDIDRESRHWEKVYLDILISLDYTQQSIDTLIKNIIELEIIKDGIEKIIEKKE